MQFTIPAQSNHLITELQPVRPSTSYVYAEPQPSTSFNFLESECILHELDPTDVNSDAHLKEILVYISSIFHFEYH